MKKQKDMPEKVWLTEESDGIPEGSCIQVESETETTYTGSWSSQFGSFSITVDKEKCTETSNLEHLLKVVSQHTKKSR